MLAVLAELGPAAQAEKELEMALQPTPHQGPAKLPVSMHRCFEEWTDLALADTTLWVPIVD